MTATDAYQEKAVGTKINGVQLENLFGDNLGATIANNLSETFLSEYGNIVANTTVNPSYTLTLYIEGNQNSIANITTDRFHSVNGYGGTIYIYKSSGTELTLGTVFGDFAVYMQNLKINEYHKENSEKDFQYLAYTGLNGTPTFENCTVEAKDRRIFTFARGIVINGTGNLSIRELKCYYEGVKFRGNTRTHVYGDIYSRRSALSVSDHASVVVDGNVMTTAQDNYSSGTIDTTGYLIVKGTVFDAANITFKQGTVLCNVFEVGASSVITGSATLIANMITSNIHNRIEYSENTERYVPIINEASNSNNIESISEAPYNEDNYPFTVYSCNAASEKTFEFSGNSSVYLLGYYRTQDGGYDLSVQATDADNPVASYINGSINTDGKLNEQFNVDTSKLLEFITTKRADNETIPECVLLGNSTYTPQTSTKRNVLISGNASVYAGGNVTFFNETSVTGGKILCNGSFGTKANLTVSGGTIQAETVGNVYDLTNDYSDNTKSWRKTVISGGNVQADVIGARDSYGNKSSDQRSLVEITGGTIKDNATIRKDQYINYIYDPTNFPEDKNHFSELNNNIRFFKTAGDNSAIWTADSAFSVTSPVMANDSQGMWIYDTLSGQIITGIDVKGNVLSSGTEAVSVTEKDRLKLYAVKNQYTLTRVYGSNYYSIGAQNTDGSALSYSNGTMTDIGDLREINISQAMVDSGAEITLAATDPQYKTRTVVWYVDASGQYHNALAGKSWTGNSITFPMPKADTYIYVIDDDHALPLDFSVSSLSFTKDGFITEFAPSDESGTFTAENPENVFEYSGNYRIVQSNIGENEISAAGKAEYPILEVNENKKTANRIQFSSDFDNTKDGGQQICVSRVFQHCADTEFGTVLKSDARVKMELDGKVAFFRFEIKGNSSLYLKGLHNDVNTDIVYFNKAVLNSPATYLTLTGNNDGKTGDLTVEGLTLDFINGYSGYLMKAKDNTQSGSLTLKNCMLTKSWGDSTGIARNIKTVTIDNCDMDITTNTGYTTEFVSGAENVTICNESKIQWKNIGSTNTGGFPIDYGISGTLTVDASEIRTFFEPRANEGTYLINPSSQSQAKNVVLQNGATFTADSRVFFNKLQVSSDSSLNVVRQSGGSEETWLLCKDILVNGGKITADNVIVSGFYGHPNYGSGSTTANYKTVLDTRIENKTDMVLEGKLEITSGSVSATDFVGGDSKAEIKVSGGTLEASNIGTSGYLYGFPRQLPVNKMDYVYRYPILDYNAYTQAATVTVTDHGTVKVSNDGYLGGMRCTVDVQGGNVILGNGAVLGMTEEQQKTLTDYYSSRGNSIAAHDDNCTVKASGGSIEEAASEAGSSVVAEIRVPYGNVALSGTAKVKLTNILADHGTITISNTKEGYSNPYQGTETGQYKSLTVGIWVTDTLSGETVTISDGAQVYAQNAYAEVENINGTCQGGLTVTASGLYAASYGEKGVSRSDEEKKYNDSANAADQTVFGTRLVSVSYVLNSQEVLFEEDLTDIINDNPASYTVTSEDKKLKLEDASCKGYYFLGWYENPECTGTKVTQLNTTIANDLTLYAKWERITVKFQVEMDKDSTFYYSGEEFANNENWQRSNDSYISAKTVTLSYGDRILTAGGINLLDYTTNTLGVTELEIGEREFSGSKVISADSIVSRDLAEYYKTKATDAVIILHVKNVQKRIAIVTFNVNRKEGKPSDAVFADRSIQKQANVSVDKTLGEVTDFAGDTESSVSETKSPGLVQPSATGYTFLGWNTDSNATGETTEGWITKDTICKVNTTIYAIWQANTYLIAFNAGDGNWVTRANQAPEKGAIENKTLNYYWVYDTPVSEKNSFWLKDDETNKYMTEMPYAWREGYVFNHDSGWTYSYKDGETTRIDTITSTEALSQIAVKALDTAVGDPEGKPTETALTVTASYTPVTVSYERNGGKWTDSSYQDKMQPTYGEALAGYTLDGNENDSADNTGAEKIVTAAENDKSVSVFSTTAEHYSTNKKYTASDYRKTLQRKGYTFYGWYASQKAAEEAVSAENSSKETSVGMTPRFENVTLYAAWKPNTYTLDLKNKDESTNYQYTDFSSVSETDNYFVQVTTGQAIGSGSWPSRERKKTWYIHDKKLAETGKRYFLGVTFAALDPGASTGDGKTVYENYAKAITALQNGGMICQNKTDTAEGTVFELPEDEEYQKATGNITYTVPDYPKGSTIPVYAVYREQSLVFVERYVDNDGNAQETILNTADWGSRSVYPDSYKENTKIINNGYALIGWYVNSVSAEKGKEYPTDDTAYKNKLSTYITEAEQNGTYDIMVYTVYAPRLSRKVTLEAKQDPTSTEHSVDSYTLPASMQSGILTMKCTDLDSKGLQFVSKKEMEAHLYDATWTKDNHTYSSDNTVAVQVTVSEGNSSVTKELSELSNGELGFNNLKAGAGAQVALTLYHSRVMTKDQIFFFDLQTCFSDGTGNNTLADQHVNNEVTIHLQPSLYTVNYEIQLPETLDQLTVIKAEDKENWGDFGRPEGTESEIQSVTTNRKVGYGSKLSEKFPELEGYKAVGTWLIQGSSDNASYDALNMKVSDANKGIINLTSSYTAETYVLSADTETLSKWDVTYTDGTNTESSGSLSETGAEVKYHFLLQFKQKDGSGNTPEEFVTLTIGDETVKLPDYGSADTERNYSFRMPASNVKASYVTVEDLYLENGTISITEDGYTQQKKEGLTKKTWRGDYQILQNADNNGATSTANQLILSGDLSSRNLWIGNLNISSENSVELKKEDSADTKAVLTLKADRAASTVTAENISAPSGTELKIRGLQNEETDNSATENAAKGKLILSPKTDFAGIGGTKNDKTSGVIALESLQLTASMPAGSEASVAGPAALSETAGDISLKNCQVTVMEGSAATVYRGVWIGGTKVPQVILDQTSLQKGEKLHMAGPLITSGETVVIKGSTLGTPDNNLTDPVYAEKKLEISGSHIYINIQDNLSNQTVSVPVGTKNGTTEIISSVLKIAKSGGQAAVSGFYSGVMSIQDADSDVTIDQHQILEVSNGTMNLNSTAYTQGTSEHPTDVTRKSYVLLEEGTVPSQAPDLTVQSLPENGQIEVRQPLNASNEGVTVGNLKIQNSTDLILNGDLVVTGTGELKSQSSGSDRNNITLKVTGNSVAKDQSYGISLTGSTAVFARAAGNAYVQDGGYLKSQSDFGDGSLDVILTNVTADVSNLYASDLSIDGGAVTATATTDSAIGSKPTSGVTTVTLKNTTVSAGTVGALGKYDQTFTTVNVENVTMNGKLVQDHYRLRYDTGRMNLTTDSLPGTLRTSTEKTGNGTTTVTVQPEGGILDSPTGTDIKLFGSWFINSGNDNNKVRKALLKEDSSLPAGLKERTALNRNTLSEVSDSDITVNTDGTSTLTVHAWMRATGTLTIQKGRLFTAFEDNTSSVSVQSNGAWTAQLVSTGTSIEGRDYQAVFASPLPEGTTLTLTEPGTDTSAGNYYYYKVSGRNISSVKFTDFTVMGGIEKFHSITETENIPETETFLLAVDFAEASAKTVNNQKVTFSLLPSEDSAADAVTMGTPVMYSLTDVTNGVISVSNNKVTVTTLPVDKSNLAGKTLFLKVVLKGTAASGSSTPEIPYNVTAQWGEKQGTWISQDTVLFEAGRYGEIQEESSGEFAFQGLSNGTYRIVWSLVSGDSVTGNITGNVVSNEVSTDYTESHTAPSLSVITDRDSRVIRKGIATTVKFNYETTSDSVKVTVEKQGALCSFSSVGETTDITVKGDLSQTKEITFGETTEAGTYRICFSMDEKSSEDNVYFTFVVR